MVTPRRVLFIGNSYTHCNRLPETIATLVRSFGAELETAMSAPGGWTLEQHWDDATSRGLLAKGGWDHVVLQEQTRRPYEDTAAYYRFAKLFDAEIRKQGARTVLYLTWAPGPEPERQPQLDESVGKLGREIGAIVVPSGPAFARVRARAPKLDLYVEDIRHPSAAGTYLSACAFVGTLWRRPIVGLPATACAGDHTEVKTLPAADTRVLQECAQAAVDEWSRGEKAR